MPTLISTVDVDDAGLADLRRPLDDLVAEETDPADPDRFLLGHGPCTTYERRLEVTGVGPGRHRVVERTTWELVVPVWGVLVRPAFRLALRRRRRRGGQPWWAPPVRLDARQVDVLARMSAVGWCSGYLGTLLSQTTTFAAGEFGADVTAQGAALASTRIGILVALVAAFAADRVGRRRALLVAVIGACLLHVTTAATPTLTAFAATQILARGLTTGGDVVRAIVVAEEMPAGARAYGLSVGALAAGLGAGMVVWLLPVADLTTWSWRLLFCVPLLLAPLVWRIGRPLPESGRFERHRATGGARLGRHRNRLVLLAAASMLTAVLAAPASGLQNEYLRSERAFSGAGIALFTLLTSTPASLGVFFGGRLADVHGRRTVGAIGLVAATAGIVVSYRSDGVGLWVGALVGTIASGMVVPTLLVYGPELFPTRLRGRANGILTLFGVTGSAIGLLGVGALADRWGSFGPAISVVAVGPLLVALLVRTRFPETAGRELEDLNPSDAAGGATPTPPR